MVIVDIGMPHLNGYELAARLRALCRQIPLMIALTGYAHAEVKEQCVKAGFHHFFLKPADPADILAVLRQYADRLSGETGTGSVSGPNPHVVQELLFYKSDDAPGAV